MSIDHTFGIENPNYPLLFREVEVYSWHETRNVRTQKRGKKKREVTEWTYTSKWSKWSSSLDSSTFKDQNYNKNI